MVRSTRAAGGLGGLVLIVVLGGAADVALGGRVTHYEYGDHGQPTGVWVEGESSGRANALSDTTYDYDTLGRRWKARRRETGGENGSNDHVTLTTFDYAGNVSKTIEKAPGNDGDDIDSDDAVTTNYYDNVGRLTKTKLTSGDGGSTLRETTYTYDASGNVTTNGQLVSGSDYLETTTEYDALSRATKVTDPEGHYKINAYDSQSRLILQTSYDSEDDPLAKQAWYYGTNGASRLTRTARFDNTNDGYGDEDKAEDQVTDYAYDSDGRMLTRKTYNMGTATALTTENEYDDAGRLTKTTDPDANWTSMDYDSNGLMTQRVVYDGLGQRTFTYDYDDLGRLTTETAEGTVDHTTVYAYDALDRRTSVTDAEGTQITYDFDALGRRTRVTENANTNGSRVTDSIYDRLGRLSKLVAYDGEAPTSPDPEDENAQTTTYSYDLAGRRTKIAYPDSTGDSDAVAFEFDLAGRMTSKTDQRANLTVYTYDDCGLLLTKTVNTNGIDDLSTYTYDGLSRMRSAVRVVGTAEVSSNGFAYNPLSHLTSETQTLFEGPAREIVYEYDQAGNRTKLTHPANDIVLSYEYDGLSRVTLVERDADTNAELIDYDYTGLHLTRRRITTTYKHGAEADCDVYIDFELEYDEHRNITSNGNVHSGSGSFADSTIAKYGYTFDKVGNRLTQETGGRYEPPAAAGPDLLRDLNYDYDGLYRLTKATYNSLTDDPHEEFQYDLLGNREGNGGAGGYGYTDTRPDPDLNIPYGDNNEANEYSSINSIAVSYDAAGNLIADEGGFFMQYDAHNQLTAVYADSNTNGTFDPGTDTAVAAYAYDALGRRIEFRNHYDGSGIYGSGPTEVVTRYVYDGQNVIEEYNTNGDRQRYYVHGTGYIDERAVMHDDDEPGGGSDAADYYFLLKDLYTVVGLAQANGHELERYVYDAYGKATVVSVLAADVNFDGSVDSLDQGAIRSPSRWLQSGCDAGTVYDINMDGTIDSLDLGVIRNPANWYHSNTELPASALGNPYFFTGRRRDAYLDAPTGTTGVKQIQYSRARYYDLDNGRWLQRDPIGYKDGMNLYEYGESHPTLVTDPTGSYIVVTPGVFYNPFRHAGGAKAGRFASGADFRKQCSRKSKCRVPKSLGRLERLAIGKIAETLATWGYKKYLEEADTLQNKLQAQSLCQTLKNKDAEGGGGGLGCGRSFIAYQFAGGHKKPDGTRTRTRVVGIYDVMLVPHRGRCYITASHAEVETLWTLWEDVVVQKHDLKIGKCPISTRDGCCCPR